MTVQELYATSTGSSTRWMDDPNRSCKGQPQDWFFPKVRLPNGDVDEEAPEPPWPLPEAKRLCDHCPVKSECLNYALTTGEPAGTWGGLSAYQRELLTKPRARKSCPGCGASDGIVHEGLDELCLACGVSWPIL